LTSYSKIMYNINFISCNIWVSILFITATLHLKTHKNWFLKNPLQCPSKTLSKMLFLGTPVLPVGSRYYRWLWSNTMFDSGRAVVLPRYFRWSGTTGILPVLPVRSFSDVKRGTRGESGGYPFTFPPNPNSFSSIGDQEQHRWRPWISPVLPPIADLLRGIVPHEILLQWPPVFSCFSPYFGLVFRWILGRRWYWLGIGLLVLEEIGAISW
jgi:hypothetical protein